MAVTVIKALYNILPSINKLKFIKKNTFFSDSFQYPESHHPARANAIRMPHIGPQKGL